jgi:hypothetical protein
MSDEPEIDRRCSSCGVAIRQRALFCPQCGKAVAPADSLAETVDLKIPESTKTYAESADTVALDNSVLESAALSKPVVQPDGPNNNSRIAQSTQAPDGSVRGRVDKLRKASTVVIEQASYDPSLRFLLVAGGLFILFILLLVLSKLLG